MCAGTIVQFRVPRVVVGESLTFAGGFIAANPELWAEDIGEL
jgi:tRNA(Arg) A34 adenosine deaminase TadA